MFEKYNYSTLNLNCSAICKKEIFNRSKVENREEEEKQVKERIKK